MLTDNPTLDQPPILFTYVALAGWLPADSLVAMFVTFMVLGERKEVNLVYAPRSIRFDPNVDGNHSVPVQIGKWLFSEERLTHHSVDRTPQGDVWAKAVGGVLPTLAASDDPPRGTPEATVRKRRAGVRRTLRNGLGRPLARCRRLGLMSRGVEMCRLRVVVHFMTPPAPEGLGGG